MPLSDKLYVIAQVRPDMLAQAWEPLRGLLTEAFRVSKNTEPHTQRDLIMAGNTQLWAVVQVGPGQTLTPVGVYFTEIIDDNGPVLDVHTMAGKHLLKWAYLAQGALENFARERKCRAVRFMGKRGLLRVYPGYQIVGEARPGEMAFERTLS